MDDEDVGKSCAGTGAEVVVLLVGSIDFACPLLAIVKKPEDLAGRTRRVSNRERTTGICIRVTVSEDAKIEAIVLAQWYALDDWSRKCCQQQENKGNEEGNAQRRCRPQHSEETLV